MTEIKLPNILLRNGDSISFTLETTERGAKLIMPLPCAPPDHVRNIMKYRMLKSDLWDYLKWRATFIDPGLD